MITLAQESYGKAAKVADNFWIIATHHRPGLSKHMFEINNRTLVFKLMENGSPVLLAANATDPKEAFAPMHEIEKETGLKLKYVVSPGSGHHFRLEAWYDEFPEATVWVPAVRIPRLEYRKRRFP